VRWLTTEHLLAEQARYQEMLADGVDPEQRRVAEARLRKIVEELERRETRVPAQHRGNRWPHVPILELFREFGAVLREKPDRTCVGDHPWRHGSKSGTCLIIWPDEGRLLCRSCMASGDAAALVADWRGCSYSDACRRLEARFGPAPVDYERLPWIKASTPRPPRDFSPSMGGAATRQRPGPLHLPVRRLTHIARIGKVGAALRERYNGRTWWQRSLARLAGERRRSWGEGNALEAEPGARGGGAGRHARGVRSPGGAEPAPGPAPAAGDGLVTGGMSERSYEEPAERAW